jgi:hypothetical protein
VYWKLLVISAIQFIVSFLDILIQHIVRATTLRVSKVMIP